MLNKVKINLTNEEYNVLNHITSATKTDCWFSLETDKDGYDCVYDLENGWTVKLATALEWLYADVDWMTLDDWEELGIDTQEIVVFTELLQKLEII